MHHKIWTAKITIVELCAAIIVSFHMTCGYVSNKHKENTYYKYSLALYSHTIQLVSIGITVAKIMLLLLYAQSMKVA